MGDYPALQAHLAEQHNELYTLVANFSPVFIDNLPYQKGPSVIATDQALLSALDSTINAFTAAITEVNEDVGRLMSLRSTQTKERESFDRRIQQLSLEISEIDHDGPIDVVKHVKFKVSVIDTSGYKRTYLEKEFTDVVDVPDSEDGIKIVKVGVIVRHYFTILRGKIVVSSESRDVHADKITTKKRDKQHLDEQLAIMVQGHEKAQEQLAVKNDLAVTTQLREKTARAMKTFLSIPWPLTTWKDMRPFYEKYQQEGGVMDSQVMLMTFQQLWMTHLEKTGQHLDFEITDVCQK